MPAYAKDGKVLCFFQCAQKFKSRYATLGFSDVATLDDGTMWPTTFALTAPSPPPPRPASPPSSPRPRPDRPQLPLPVPPVRFARKARR